MNSLSAQQKNFQGLTNICTALHFKANLCKANTLLRSTFQQTRLQKGYYLLYRFSTRLLTVDIYESLLFVNHYNYISVLFCALPAVHAYTPYACIFIFKASVLQCLPVIFKLCVSQLSFTLLGSLKLQK